MYKTKREMYEKLRSQLELERSSFLTHWRSLSDFLLPRRSRFTVTDVNRGERRNQNIIDSTGTMALRTLRSGMMAGVTSPARPWFRLTTPDPGLAEYGPVKDWLYMNGQRMQTIFYRSNLYQALPVTYGDIGCFGTHALLEEEDFEHVVRFYPFPIGSYMISCNQRLQVDTFVRDFRMTVRQIVEKFGIDRLTNEIVWDNISLQVKNLWEQGNTEVWMDICHVIRPNDDFDPRLQEQSKYKRYSSCYYERGTGSTNAGQNYLASTEDDKYLRESGYDYFPVLCPRWEITGEDAYGTECPGMTVLGDVKELQAMQRRKSEAVEKLVRPPMKAPSSLVGKKASILPGDMTFTDEMTGQTAFQPVYQVDPRVGELMQDIQDKRDLIRKGLYEDLFLMLANSDRRQITAREIEERHEEKLLALGPVLEQLNQDLLDPLIDITFDIMARQGMISEPPQELQGMPLKVEYISVMAQAQKLIGISGVERYTQFASGVASIDPGSLMKTNTDQLLDVYADFTSIPPGIVRPDEEVAAMREQQAKQQQMAQMAEMMQQSAGTAKELSQADMEGDNALTRLSEQAGAGQLVPA